MNIEKNIPIPERNSRTGSAKEMYETMVMGDSVYFTFDEGANKISNALRAANHKKYKTQQFTSRSDKNGIRFWRIAVGD
jgi:hypothetical protein